MRIIGTLDARTGRITPTIVPTIRTTHRSHLGDNAMSTNIVPNAVLDAARAIARLDAHAGIDPQDRVKCDDGTEWTGEEMLDAVARHLLERMRYSLTAGTNTYGVPLSTVTAMLAALGATQHTINVHGQQIAKRMRRDWRNGS